jgi:hypothetical protein
MADQDRVSPLAPTAVPPERQGSVYEVKQAPDAPGGRGPLRFEEGLGTDTAIPRDFVVGIMQGYTTPPGRPNHNANVYIKSAQETTQERAHPGSAAWTESPTYMGDFVQGAGPEAEVKFIAVERDGAHYNRINPAKVQD